MTTPKKPATATPRKASAKPTDGQTTSDTRKTDDKSTEALEARVNDMQSSLDAIMAMMKASTAAKDNPVSITKEQAGPVEDQDFTAYFADDNSLVTAPNADINCRHFKSKMERMAFDKEIITINVAHTHHEHEVTDTRFEVSVNGRPLVFEEGGTYQIPRAYAEVLYRAMQMSVQSVKAFNSLGEETYKYPTKDKMRHPISILRDPNPKSREWLEGLRAS